MAYVYTDFATLANLKDFLLGAHIVTSDSSFTMSDDAMQAILDAREDQLKIETSRQFVPGSAGEVRYFDGTGHGVMRIDEYIDITAIEFFYTPGTASISATNYVEVTRKPWANDVVKILQGQANINYGFFQRFPEGRENIKITATWGYASTIPKDVWLAHLQASAADVMQANTLSAQGQTLKYTDGDASEQWTGETIGESAGWLGKGSLWERVLRNYKRSLRSHILKSRPKLI